MSQEEDHRVEELIQKLDILVNIQGENEQVKKQAKELRELLQQANDWQA